MLKIKSNKQFLIMFQGLIFFFLLLNYVVHDISFSSIIRIFLYQFFAWFLAGRAIVLFFKIQAKNYLEGMALSYTFGAVSSVVIYLFFMIPGFGFLLPVFTVVEGAAAVFYIYKKKIDINEYEVENFGMMICLIFLAIYFILSFCAVSLVNSLPNETGGTGYYVDWPFWAGNNIALTKNFPVDSFRQIGYEFKYHFFSSILMAQTSLCTGVDINWISFYFSSILAGIIFILSGYYFATRLVKNKWLIVVVMIAALFTDGTTVTYTWHTNICPFGFDYGYAYGMMSLAILAEIINNNRFEELFVPLCLCLAMTTGCKGPIGTAALAAYGAAAIYYLLQKKIKRGLVAGLSWLVSFLAVYMAFINAPTTFNADAGGVRYIGGLGIDTIISTAPWIADAYNSLLSAYRIMGDHLMLKLYAVWLYIYRADKVVMTLLLIAIGVMLYDLRKKRFNVLLYCLFFSALSGILLAIYTVQSGGSQMYFMMGAFPAATMAGGYALERIFEEIKAKKVGIGLYKVLCIVLLFTLGISTSQYYNTIMAKVREGVAVARGKYTADDYGAYYADVIDYEAFNWLKENTDSDAIFAIDGHLDMYGRGNNMIAGIFSQRFLWNENKYVNDLAEAERRDVIVGSLSVEADAAVTSMKSEGVDYLICQVFDDKEEYGTKTDFLTEVFRNSHYIIYKL